MKIGEIAVVGPKMVDKKSFLSVVCSDIRTIGHNILFGRVSIGDNFILHIYSIDVLKNPAFYNWDILVPRLSGFIVLYNWHMRQSFEGVQRLLDFLYSKYDVPFVIAADTGTHPPPVPNSFHASGIRLSRDSKVVFWSAADSKTVRRVYTTLFDMLIDRTPELYD